MANENLTPEQMAGLIGWGSKATKMHGMLNLHGWSFGQYPDISVLPEWLLVDHHSERIPGYNVAVLVDVVEERAKVFLTRSNVHKRKAIPKPVHGVLQVKLRSGMGGAAWANDVEKALNALSGTPRS